MRKPRLLSLCSGIGAIDLAAMIAGCEIAGQVEIDPFGQAVLLKNFGDLPRRADIKEVATYDAETLTSVFGDIDIVAGGIPCQPFSSAGKRRGRDDDRYLWPQTFAIVLAARPTWVLIENVDDFKDMALDSVSADLETADYTCQAFVLPACAVGAPHIRERIFVLAHSSSHRCGIRQDQSQYKRGSVGLTDAGLHGAQESLAYTRSAGRRECDVTAISGESGHAAWRNLAPGTERPVESSTGRREWQHQSTGGTSGTQSLTIQPGERTVGARMGRGFDGFADWLDRYQWPAGPGEAQHTWEPPRTTPGKQLDRGRRLKALGNAVVWQQVYPFFAFITQQYAAQP